MFFAIRLLLIFAEQKFFFRLLAQIENEATAAVLDGLRSAPYNVKKWL